MEKTAFQKIIDKELPADILYEDEHTLAFLDIFPNTKGHALVIPKKACVNIFDCDADTIAHVARTLHIVAPAVRDAVGAKGVHINSNHNPEAGQVVPHLHFHIIPRHSRDEFEFWPANAKYAEGESEALAEKIRSNITR